MLNSPQANSLQLNPRRVTQAVVGDPDLGPFINLPGVWTNEGRFPGRGWNMIALPFGGGQFGYRLLMNQSNETLTVTVADKGVPNRGLGARPDPVSGDQTIIALDYEQLVSQIAVDDFPQTDLTRTIPKPIHHEPGLFLNMANKVDNDLVIARLGTIPHGDSVLALGRVTTTEGAPVMPHFSGLPIGLGQDDEVLTDADPNNPLYMDPYKHFHHNHFRNLFDPVDPLNLLEQAANALPIVRSTTFDFDTTLETGGILNIPFVTRTANATQMRSIFWLHELSEQDATGAPIMVLQYAQIVMLEFFRRRDGQPGLIKWPHVSINTMSRATKEPVTLAQMLRANHDPLTPSTSLV
jgi:hypothetical protein